MTNRNHQPRYAYIAPTYSQAKKIARDYLKHFTDKIPGTKYNETELRCDLVNGARITLLSSENPDSIRGIYLDGCIIDEAAQVQAALIDEVITPALSDRKGFMILVGTPAGMNNLFYDYYQKAQSNKNWFLYKAKASETKIVDKEELQAALGVMGVAKYNQEFECSFIGNIKGSIYGDLLGKLEDKKQVASIPYDPAFSFFYSNFFKCIIVIVFVCLTILLSIIFFDKYLFNYPFIKFICVNYIQLNWFW